jgi:hypothetical protein
MFQSSVGLPAELKEAVNALLAVLTVPGNRVLLPDRQFFRISPRETAFPEKHAKCTLKAGQNQPGVAYPSAMLINCFSMATYGSFRRDEITCDTRADGGEGICHEFPFARLTGGTTKDVGPADQSQYDRAWVPPHFEGQFLFWLGLP